MLLKHGSHQCGDEHRQDWILATLKNHDRYTDVIACKARISAQFLHKSLLPSIIAGSVFNSFKEDVQPQKEGSIPKAHYVFGFEPSVNTVDTILLDVLFEENPYK
jgi:hypothetical protein